MSGSWPKVIRDPVHNLIPFEDTRCDRLLLDLINSREFQRLRRIKQLGVSELVFPGANHSRFAHSIGVMHTARAFLARIRQMRPELLSEDRELLVLAAALIHDVGHGPFSHAFEAVTKDKHEARTRQIILDDSTEINRCLRRCSADLPERIELFFHNAIDDAQFLAADVPPLLSQIVSSQLDADRFDYLLRDSHATGTNYGNFDPHWLILHLHLEPEKGRFFLSRKALAAAEDYVFARYHMYRTVYYHKTTRAAEVMLRLLFGRFRQLVDESGPQSVAKIVPNAPVGVVDAFAGSLTLPRYLDLDDHAMSEFLKGCAGASDPLLVELGSGLLNRRLYKAIDVTDHPRVPLTKFVLEATDLIRRKGVAPEYCLVYDEPSDTPYKPYDPDAEKPATQIYLEQPTGGPREIGPSSPAIETLKRTYSLLRYYFPERVRDDIQAIAAKTLT